ncbi:MAG TPA: hypothetical protein VHO94_04255 [Oscillospiraceae bacterium]|nr:hypothetical protein [Oscillospiraceae bacterium]
MTELEIIARQAEKILELEDKLAEEKETAKYWECEATHSLRVHRQSPAEEHNLLADLMKMGVKL